MEVPGGVGARLSLFVRAGATLERIGQTLMASDKVKSCSSSASVSLPGIDRAGSGTSKSTAESGVPVVGLNSRAVGGEPHQAPGPPSLPAGVIAVMSALSAAPSKACEYTKEGWEYLKERVK